MTNIKFITHATEKIFEQINIIVHSAAAARLITRNKYTSSAIVAKRSEPDAIQYAIIHIYSYKKYLTNK